MKQVHLYSGSFSLENTGFGGCYAVFKYQGHKENEKCDKIARSEAENIKKSQENIYERI